MNAMTEMPAQFESFAAEAQKNMSQSMEKMAKSFEDMAAFNQASVDAMMKSATVSMKGMEELNAELIAFSKRSMEDGVAAAKDVAASKSVMEMVEKQGAFAKSWVDGCMKQMTRMNELALAASKDAMEPLSARASAAAELAKGQAA